MEGDLDKSKLRPGLVNEEEHSSFASMHPPGRLDEVFSKPGCPKPASRFGVWSVGIPERCDVEYQELAMGWRKGDSNRRLCRMCAGLWGHCSHDFAGPVSGWVGSRCVAARYIVRLHLRQTPCLGCLSSGGCVRWSICTGI